MLWWHSQPHTPTWLCQQCLAGEQGMGEKWQPDKGRGCKGNSCWDRGDPEQAELRAAAWVALHPSIHLSYHHPWTRALQASWAGQRKARINNKAPTMPWIHCSDTSHDPSHATGVALSPCCAQRMRPFLLPGARSGHGWGKMSHYQLINSMEKGSLLCSTVFCTSCPIHWVEQIINSSVSWARLEEQKMSLSWQKTIVLFIFFKVKDKECK